MKYVEIGATYEVLVPEDWGGAYETSHIGSTTYKDFWDGRLFTVKRHAGPYVHGLTPGRTGQCSVYMDWLYKLVEHCPQVQHYIEYRFPNRDRSQEKANKPLEKETYLSPFTGQIE